MTFAAYLIIGVVVWAIVTIETCIREGVENVKTSHTPGWTWFTDMILTALLWPYVVLCYVIGAIGVGFKNLKGES